MRLPRRTFAILLLGLLVIRPGAADAASEAKAPRSGQRTPVAHVGDQAIAFPAGGRALRLPVFASGPVDRPAPGVRRAVIVLHGLRRNADTYLAGMVQAVGEAGLAADTLVVAPQFLADVDAAGRALPDDVPRWSLQGWKDGGDAVHPAGLPAAAGSSFAALDAVLDHFADRALYPALGQVVVAGHSAGGQVLARYAAAGRGDERLRARGVAVRYVIANPSSYLYFDERRPAPETGGFRPYPAADCPDFNRYKYGLESPVPYVAAMPADGMLRRFLARDVVYLLGGADTDPDHRYLDRSCAGRAQGPHRLGRGTAYMDYLHTLTSDTAPHHRLLVVPGIGHDNRAMFASAQGREALFAGQTR